MNVAFGKMDYAESRDSRYPASGPATTTLVGEGFKKFKDVDADKTEVGNSDEGYNSDQNGASRFEDPLSRQIEQIEETFKRVKDCLDRHCEATGDGGQEDLQTDTVADAFKALFGDNKEEACVFLESRFYYGSQAPSPIDRLNLACKEGTLNDSLSLIRGTYEALQQGAHF